MDEQQQDGVPEPTGSTTPVEEERLRIERATGRDAEQPPEDIAGIVLSGVVGLVLGLAVGGIVVAATDAHAGLVVTVAALVGLFLGMGAGVQGIARPGRRARREFADLRDNARTERPVRYRRRGRSAG